MRFRKLIAVLAIMFAPMRALADPTHYFVVKDKGGGNLSVVFHQIVQLRSALESKIEPESSSRWESKISVLLRDKSTGDTIFDGVAGASPWLRGEFHGDHEIDGHHFPIHETFYVVRVPVQVGAKMELGLLGAVAPKIAVGDARYMRSGSSLEVDLDIYAEPQEKLGHASIQSKGGPPPPSSSTGNIYLNGDPRNRLNLLVIAEGYTSSEQAKFVQDAKALADGFLSISPYADFSHLINVSWLFVPSNQSGADKPECPETPGAPVVTKDTAFDGTFCANGIRRLVTVNLAKVYTAAAGAPDWDKIMVLVNEFEYGGSGGALSVATTNTYSAEIMQHEFGHSFSRLADEYSDPNPGKQSCNDQTLSAPCEANVTNQTDIAALKWAGWVKAQTPIPTTAPLVDPLGAGLWEGARNQAMGMYRQCFNGIMRSLGQPFCRVDSEAFVTRLYTGAGFLTHQFRMIEPDVLPSATTLSAMMQTGVIFQGVLAGSLAPGGLTATWLVDGAVQKTEVGTHGSKSSFTYQVPDAASHSVILRITDSTPFLLTRPINEVGWNIVGLSTTTCVYHAPVSALFGPGASAATADITTNAACYWSAVSNDSWIHVEKGYSSIGSGSVTYSLTANTGNGPRSGTITVAGKVFTILQNAFDAQFVPGAPIIGAATSGESQATIAFTPPVNQGGSAITGYTATCNPGAYVGNATSSPVIVLGLTNFMVYTCSVTASNLSGTGATSGSVIATPEWAPVLVQVVSRKYHGAGGPYDLKIATGIDIDGAVDVESRAGGPDHQVVFEFNGPIAAIGAVSVIPLGSASAIIDGTEVIVTLMGVPDKSRVMLALANVKGKGKGVDVGVSIGFLLGDVSNSRAVNASDISAVKAKAGLPITGTNFRFDINADGVIDSNDVSAMKTRSGAVLP